MDRAIAIATHQTALTRIVAALIAMAGLANGGVATRLPHRLYRALWRVLYPAESAVRRLIVIAARGLTVKLPPVRAMPKGLALNRESGGRRSSFQLFDTRKRFSSTPRTFANRGVPRIHWFGVSPLVPLFQSRPVESPIPEPNDTVIAVHLGRRLAAIKMALDNLPRQAKRLVRWQARRDRMESPAFRTPLRPGLPPGHRKEPGEEIDLILIKCHALAWQALSEDTS